VETRVRYPHPEDRIRAINLARELGSALHGVTTLHAEGSLLAQKLSFYALGEWNSYKTAAKRAAQSWRE